MRFELVRNEEGVPEWPLSYKVWSPWFESKTILIDKYNLDNAFKDEFVWALFDELDKKDQKIQQLSKEFESLQKNHIRRAFNMSELQEKIKNLELKLNGK